MLVTDSDIERFSTFIGANDTDCWPWIGASTGRYGAFWLNGKQELAHRVAYVISIGPIPDGLFVLHHCDDGLCVNPEHLFVGSAAENTADMFAKGRAHPPKNEDHWQAKVTKEMVLEIRKLREECRSTAWIGKKFGLARQTVADIVYGRTWRNV